MASDKTNSVIFQILHINKKSSKTNQNPSFASKVVLLKIHFDQAVFSYQLL